MDTLITKLDFQGDDLYVHYNQRGDSDLHIKSRALIINWKANTVLLELLKKMFQSVIEQYLVGDSKINWDQFALDFKKYEERNKNDHS